MLKYADYFEISYRECRFLYFIPDTKLILSRAASMPFLKSNLPVIDISLIVLSQENLAL